MDNKELLKTVANNQALLEALKSHLLKQFEAPTTFKDLPASTSDELLGQFLRARIAGINAVEDAFREISQLKMTPKPVDNREVPY